LDSWQKNKQSFDDLANKCLEFYNLALGTGCPKENIRFWADHNEERVSYDLQRKLNLIVSNAYKYDKKLGLLQLSSLVESGNLLIREDDSVLQEEFEQSLYKRNDEELVIYEIDDNTHHPDALMALLY
jgi:hypothetical protein